MAKDFARCQTIVAGIDSTQCFVFNAFRLTYSFIEALGRFAGKNGNLYSLRQEALDCGFYRSSQALPSE